MNIAEEKWETIQGFPNYMISSFSRVLNKTTLNMVSVSLHQHGFRVVRLWRNNKTKLFKIYRLKAIHFIPNPDNKKQVNHLDGNRLNEDLDNLEWTTPSENMKHAVLNGFCGGQFKKGFDHSQAKLKPDDVIKIRQLREQGMTMRAIAKEFGLASSNHICKIVHRKIYADV